jgi:lysophospholipase L1-like esterase
MHRSWRVGTASLAVVLFVAACSGGSRTPAPTIATTPEPTADLEHPVGILAVGHSALTGEGVDTFGPGQANLAASYATGTDPAVNSMYLRLVAVAPETEGHVQNEAAGGASSSALVAQITSGLAALPAPRLVIIQTVDNDIVCDASHATKVGADVAAALAVIHEASPNTVILVVGQPGRPHVDYIETLVAAHPEQKAALTWDDPCTFYTADGKINPEGIAMLAASIDTYEAENARVCALVPNCFTDGGVRRTWVDKLEYYSPDFAHFNAVGQAAEAEQLWPVVQELLGLGS